MAGRLWFWDWSGTGQFVGNLSIGSNSSFQLPGPLLLIGEKTLKWSWLDVALRAALSQWQDPALSLLVLTSLLKLAASPNPSMDLAFACSVALHFHLLSIRVSIHGAARTAVWLSGSVLINGINWVFYNRQSLIRIFRFKCLQSELQDKEGKKTLFP